jgi:hypothetical protein
LPRSSAHSLQNLEASYTLLSLKRAALRLQQMVVQKL